MHVKFILFESGSGGNFLARVLTLDPSTVNLGDECSTVEQRLARYRYDTPLFGPDKTYNAMLPSNLSYWVDIELNQYYFPFTRGIPELCELNKLVVEPIHSRNFDDKLLLLGKDDIVEFYYIDPSDCDEWIKDQIHHKISGQRTFSESDYNQNIDHLYKLSQQYNMQPISLAAILKDQVSFINEYLRICDIMNLIPHCAEAEIIYKTWKATWKTA